MMERVIHCSVPAIVILFIKEDGKLELSRRFGIVIVCGVPAIVGSGLLWALADSWILVFAYLFLLSATLLLFIVNPGLFTNYSQIWNPTVGKVKGLVARLQTFFSSA
jgi:hypothetical protein